VILKRKQTHDMANTSMETAGAVKEDFAALLEESLGTTSNFEGQVVKGRVIAIDNDIALVDVGLKSEGRIPLKEFSVQGGEPEIGVGDEVEVFVERMENHQGESVLSREKARREEAWTQLEQAFKDAKRVTGVIFGRVKGGFTVDLSGAVAFLPGSQVDIRPVRDVSPLMGTPQPFQILKMDRQRGNIVVSRRAVLEETRAEARTELVANLKEGQVLQGVVKNITDYGAFVDLGGIDGLLHVTDISWKRVNHPSDALQIGQTVDVQVIRFNPETQRISLGMKQLEADPWDGVVAKYPVRAKLKGRVTNITDYGAFVELEPGVEGLVHVSEMSWTRRVKHPSKMVSVGDVVEAVVLDVDVANNRISLGMKQLEPNPYESLNKKYPPGTQVKGTVRNIADFGIFVEIEEGIDGLVHISDMSWTQRVKHPSELFQKGDEVEAVLLNIDTDDGEKPKISLGIKQLVADPWDRIPNDYPIGKVVSAKVLKILDFGAFVEIEKGVEGLVHVSEISAERVEHPADVLNPDQEVQVQIISMDGEERKIGLSIKSATRQQELADAQGYVAGQKAGGATLGDVMRQKLGDLAVGGDEKADADSDA